MPNANAMNTKSLVKAEQVAQHLGAVKNTVYRWRERKGLPAHKIAGLWKFKLSEVDEWDRADDADDTPNSEPGGKKMVGNAQTRTAS